MIKLMLDRGISQRAIDMCRYFDIDFDQWLSGFETIERSVHESVKILKEHPLIPDDVRIWGFIIDSTTGKLTPVE